MRTPLAGIVAVAELLRKKNLPEEGRVTVSQIANSADVLMQIVNDMLDATRIAAGRIIIEKQLFSISECIRVVEDMGSIRAKQKGIDFTWEIDERILPLQVISDQPKLKQTLLNIVFNAIKFTRDDVPGWVTCRTFLAEDSPNENKVNIVFEIKDNGIGISPQGLSKIFLTFSQLDPKKGGTGLGLYISRQLIELMGGTISCKSQPGQGTTFTITIPFELSKTSLSPPVETSDTPLNRFEDISETAQILVVDDNELNRKVAVKFLNHFGLFNCDVAVNGVEALEAMTRKSYHLVLMDCMMPHLDGYSATRQYREFEKLRGISPPTPIVALTG